MKISTVNAIANAGLVLPAGGSGGSGKAGKNCTIQNIEPIEGGNRITFLWTRDDGNTSTATMDVKDGKSAYDLAVEHGFTGTEEEWIGEIESVAYQFGFKQEGDKWYFSLTENAKDEQMLEIPAVFYSGGGGGSSTLSANLKASKTVGGISSGKEYASGTDLQVILRDMLNPVENPTFTAPSATIAGNGASLLEAGTTASKTLTVTFNRGSISPAYGTSGKRSGEATGYALNGGDQQSGNTFSVTVSESNKSFSAVVSYAAGEQPKNSAGENYSTPLAAGTVTTNTLTYEFVDAMWSNAANIATIAKESLVSKSTKQKVFAFPAQGGSNWETFDIPASWTVTAVEVLNTLNNQYQDCASEFSVSDVTHGSVAYKRYTYSTGVSTGARSIRVKWS